MWVGNGENMLWLTFNRVGQERKRTKTWVLAPIVAKQ
jgi:hypothetical protein